LLEELLNSNTDVVQQAEVMNFAISGYGPNHYAAVSEIYGPLYNPDIIIIGFFVNDYQDVLEKYEDVQREIGFGRPEHDSVRSILHLSHLLHLIKIKIKGRVMELVRQKPDWYGYFLGSFRFLERDTTLNWKVEGKDLTVRRLRQVKAAADNINAQVVIAMIPAPVQVCGPQELAYFPRHVNLDDEAKFDLDLPQRMTREIADALGFGFYDLRPHLREFTGECPYQPYNMHWTEGGHAAVAAYLADSLIDDGYLNVR